MKETETKLKMRLHLVLVVLAAQSLIVGRDEMALCWEEDNGHRVMPVSRMKRLVCFSSQEEMKRAVEGEKSINCSCELSF